jgi:subtilisin family serine protease
MLEELKQAGEIVSFEPDHEVTGADYVWDGQVVNQTAPPNWGLVRISERSKKENSNQYPYPATAGSSVIVYVLDTGVNGDHEQLSGRVTMGPNFSPTGQQVVTDVSSQDDNGHGTFIAGVVAGRDVGVAKKVSITAVKILDSKKKGRISNVLMGLNWVYAQHVDRGPNAKSIINVSVDADKSDTLNQALADCAAAGIIVVAAAGNSDDLKNPTDACNRSPGGSTTSIVVGSFDMADRVSRFSNRGSCVSLYAPGEQVRSLSYTDTSGTTIDQGTSFACPHVTGVVALLLAEWKGPFTAQEIKDWMMKNGTKDILKDVKAGNVLDGNNIMLFSGGLVGRTDTVADISAAASNFKLSQWVFTLALLYAVA